MLCHLVLPRSVLETLWKKWLVALKRCEIKHIDCILNYHIQSTGHQCLANYCLTQAAEAVLSTDEETPSPSPNVVQFFPTVQKQEQYLQQQQQQQQLQEQQRRQHGNQEASKPSQQPVVKQQAEETSSPSVDMMTSWVYCDPQGEVQGVCVCVCAHARMRACMCASV